MASPRNRRSGVPTIACYNRATIDLGCDFDRLIAALQIYVDEHVAPVWGTPAKLVRASRHRQHTWTLVFVNRYVDPADKDYLGYHNYMTREHLPKSIVFVESAINEDGGIPGTASHEIVEMLVDPGCNLYTLGPHGRGFYAYESADPVEETYRNINGLPMSNFVYPEYFEEFHGVDAMQFDWLGMVRKPFELLHGGYQSMFTRGGWREKMGSPAKAKRFAREDRRGHRSEFRRLGGFSRPKVVSPEQGIQLIQV